MPVIFLERVADDSGTLLPARRAVRFRGAVVTDVPDETLTGTVAAPGGVTGYTDVDFTASGASVFIVGSVAAARALPSNVYVVGTEVHVATTYTTGGGDVTQKAVYVWCPSLAAADDGVLVLKPSDLFGNGRLLRVACWRTGVLYSGAGQGLAVAAGTTPPDPPGAGNLALSGSAKVIVEVSSNVGVSYDGTSLGFHGSTGVPRQTLTASLSDQQAQIDEIVGVLVSYGLVTDGRT